MAIPLMMMPTRILEKKDGEGSHKTRSIVGAGTRVNTPMSTLLWILAVVLVVAGVLAILRKQLLWGIVLIIVGLLVGPGGVSIFA